MHKPDELYAAELAALAVASSPAHTGKIGTKRPLAGMNYEVTDSTIGIY